MSYALRSRALTAYTPTVTGFSSTTRTVGYYQLDGKLCTVIIDVLGTSNTTAFTVTLPFTVDNSATATLQWAGDRFIDNGVGVSGLIRTRAASSNIADLYATAAGGAWTGSGTKGGCIIFTYITE